MNLCWLKLGGLIGRRLLNSICWVVDCWNGLPHGILLYSSVYSATAHAMRRYSAGAEWAVAEWSSSWNACSRVPWVGLFRTSSSIEEIFSRCWMSCCWMKLLPCSRIPLLGLFSSNSIRTCLASPQWMSCFWINLLMEPCSRIAWVGPFSNISIITWWISPTPLQFSTISFSSCWISPSKSTSQPPSSLLTASSTTWKLVVLAPQRKPSCRERRENVNLKIVQFNNCWLKCWSNYHNRSFSNDWLNQWMSQWISQRIPIAAHQRQPAPITSHQMGKLE